MSFVEALNDRQAPDRECVNGHLRLSRQKQDDAHVGEFPTNPLHFCYVPKLGRPCRYLHRL